MADHPFLITIKKIKELIQHAGKVLIEDQLKFAIQYIEHGEPELALESIAETILEKNKHISQALFEHIKEIYEYLEIKESELFEVDLDALAKQIIPQAE